MAFSNSWKGKESGRATTERVRVKTSRFRKSAVVQVKLKLGDPESPHVQTVLVESYKF